MWARVESNNVVEVVGSLPDTWLNITNPAVLSQAELIALGWYTLEDSQITVDQSTVTFTDYSYIIQSDKVIRTRNYIIKDSVTIEKEKQDNLNNAMKNLHESYDNYLSIRLNSSGSALVTIGILQGKPKCLLVKDWVKALYIDYYTRNLTLQANPASTPNLDFSNNGELPVTIPELMAEVGI